MSLRTVTFFTYRTGGGARPWSSDELGVLRFVHALKGKPLRDAQKVRINGQFRTLSPSNRSDAFAWFAEMATAVIQRELHTTAVVLVPIPDSHCVAGSSSSRTAELAHAISSSGGQAITRDVLCWDEEMTPSSGGGPRQPKNLYPHLALRSRYKPISRPHVLIDDVETTGGHMRACAAFLRGMGANVALGIAAAQTEPEKQPDAFAEQVRDRDDYQPNGNS